VYIHNLVLISGEPPLTIDEGGRRRELPLPLRKCGHAFPEVTAQIQGPLSEATACCRCAALPGDPNIRTFCDGHHWVGTRFLADASALRSMADEPLLPDPCDQTLSTNVQRRLVWKSWKPRGLQLTKEKQSHKIDVVIALAMAALHAVEQGAYEQTSFVEPIIIRAPRHYFGDVGNSIDAPHLDMYKSNWPTW
jgi:hypothetical protein